MFLIPFLSMLALLRVSPMMYDGWKGPVYYNQYGGLLSWLNYVVRVTRPWTNGRVASNFFCGILESFYSEIPLDIVAALVMTGILAAVVQLFHIQKKTIVACLFTVFVIFMPYSLRVYVVQIALLQFLAPVLFLLLALLFLKKYEETGKRGYIGWLCPLSVIACMWMENTSVAYGVVLAVSCLRLTIKQRKVNIGLIWVLLLSLASGIFMITAPGMVTNRIEAAGTQTFITFAQERFFSHFRAFFNGFIYSGSMAGCAFALILLFASAWSAVSLWEKRGFLICFALCAGNLGWMMLALYLGAQTHEFRYAATLTYCALANQPVAIVMLSILYIIWIPLNALILCNGDWDLSMVSLYGICLLLVVLPTNQIGARIYAPYYLIMSVLACVILSRFIGGILAHRWTGKVFVIIFSCLCIVAADFQVQLCARISRVQAERLHCVELLRNEQFLGRSTSDYYIIPVFNVRDAYLGGDATVGAFHYPLFLQRYGLRQDTKLVFSNEDCVLVQEDEQPSSFRVCVVHQRGKEYLYDYIVSRKESTSQNYTAIIHEKQCADSSYQVEAVYGESWYKVEVMLTDPETGEQTMLNQTIEKYLYGG